MSVYIKGMEMPTSCDMCWALDDYGDYPRCRITEEQRGYNFRIREKRMDKCPLIPVPEHGRLIDADAMSEKDNNDFSASIGTAVGFAAKQMMIMAHAQLQQAIENQPTIIPADKEGEG